ncbi:MAG: hypothetical protein K9M75_06905, partial [Phycisphaerae bacterium]|nr:hypothetical protein [Phycisphaerae bacterium]
LTSDTLFPVSEDVSSIDLTLTVNDASNPDVSDSMTIDVYLNACQAARAGLGLDAEADYDESCLVDVADLAKMAGQWLDDTSATEAQLNPTQPGELIPNAGFTFYKPGTDYTVTALFNATDGFVNGVGDNLPLSTDDTVDYSDGTTGVLVDIPGWVNAEGTTPQFYKNFGVEGTTALTVFAAWNKTGGRVESAENLGYIQSSSTYTLSAKASGGIFGDVNLVTRLELLVDGAAITPSIPLNATVATANGDYQDISVTYDEAALADHIGKPFKVLVGTGPSPDATVNGRGWMDDVKLDITVNDPAAPSVDAGADMVTWLGEPVQLAPIVEPNDLLDPQPVLVYNWTAGTLFGYDVNISDPAIEAPTVTVTNVPLWREAPVVDPNFEERENFDPFPESTDKYIQWAKEGWRYFECDNNGGPVRIWNPGVKGVDEGTQGYWDVGFDGNMPEGKYGIVVITRYNDNEMQDIRPIRDYEAAVQIIDEAFNPNATYELTVQVGRLPEGPDEGGSMKYNWDIGADGIAGTEDDAPRAGWNGYAVQLAVGGENSVGSAMYAGHVIGGTVVAEDYNTETVPANGFTTVTVTYTPGSASADLKGLPLQVRLCALENPADHSTTSYAAFDDVKLMTDAPPALEPIELTLSVNNEGGSTVVTDFMKIDLYETACEVTKAVDPSAIDDTDHNIDCTTNLIDFAVLAADWLGDYSLTGPVAK